jgi:hypothetical protein
MNKIFAGIKKRSVLVLFLLVTAAIAMLIFWSKYDVISDRFGREYRNFTGSQQRQEAIESYAGCQARTMIDQLSDEEFSKLWEKYSKELNFDAKDVDEWMKKRCPVQTTEQIKYNQIRYQDALRKETGTVIDNGEINSRIERSEDISRYQLKFLNREFSALRGEK